MAMNRLYICAVDDDMNVKRVRLIAKTSGGEWTMRWDDVKDPKSFVEDINEFMLDAFINERLIAFKDESDEVSRVFGIFPGTHTSQTTMYRDGDGTWHCRACEDGADKETGSDGMLDSWHDSWAPNFCPYCGAKNVANVEKEDHGRHQ